MESFVVRFVKGGESQTGMLTGPEWPLPDVIRVMADNREADGLYRKVSESGLSPQDPDAHVMRGATYEWESVV